jgi:capsular polysaccharide biosynthesis protein
MPDIFLVIARRWSLVLLLTVAGTAAAFVASLLTPKLYLGATTALPVNTLVNDKARIFNQNIEALYSEIGTADELDKIEGTAKLDTLFLAVAETHHLAAHYNLDTAAGDALEKAALMLRKSSDISRTGYGELKIKVWDKNNEMAATLANALMQTINGIHERLQTENNRMILQKLKEVYAQKLAGQNKGDDQVIQFRSANGFVTDTIAPALQPFNDATLDGTELSEERKQYAGLINQYEMALKTTPKVLLVVEQARPSHWHDRPKTSQNVVLAFLASLLFSFLLAVFVESRKARA